MGSPDHSQALANPSGQLAAPRSQHTTAGHGADLFDPFSAIILRGIDWILEGGADDCPPGVQDYPRELEQEIAELTAKSRA